MLFLTFMKAMHGLTLSLLLVILICDSLRRFSGKEIEAKGSELCVISNISYQRG